MALTDPIDTHGHTVADAVATYPGLGDAETGAVITLTTSAAADDIIDTTEDHGLTAGQLIRFATLTGGTGLTAGTVYKVSATSLAATTFRVTLPQNDTDLEFSANITAGTVEPATEMALAQSAAEVNAQIDNDPA